MAKDPPPTVLSSVRYTNSISSRLPPSGAVVPTVSRRVTCPPNQEQSMCSLMGASIQCTHFEITQGCLPTRGVANPANQLYTRNAFWQPSPEPCQSLAIHSVIQTQPRWVALPCPASDFNFPPDRSGTATEYRTPESSPFRGVRTTMLNPGRDLKHVAADSVVQPKQAQPKQAQPEQSQPKQAQPKQAQTPAIPP